MNRKKTILCTLLLVSGLAFSQSKFTYEQCVVSKSKYVILNFLKQNPNHLKVKEVQAMLDAINSGNAVKATEYKRTSSFVPSGSFVINNNNNMRKPEFANLNTSVSTSVGNAVAENTNTNTNTENTNTVSTSRTSTSSPSTKATSSSNSETASNAASKLNYLLNDNKNSNMAFIAFKNASNCPISVSITGKKVYSVSVPALGDNNVLVEKGTYLLNSKVCKARYKKTKEVNGDIQIILKD